MKAAANGLADAGALIAVQLAVASPSIWGRLYFENNSVGFLMAGAALLIGLPVALIALLAWRWPAVQGQRLLRSLTVAFAAVWLVILFDGGTLVRSSRTLLVLAALVAGAGAYMALGAGQAGWWPRSRAALATAGLVFFLSSPLIGRMASPQLQWLSSVAASNRVPTVWLLLDETSSGASEQLVAPLRAAGLWTSVTQMTSAGQNTLDIVPSLFARHTMGPATAPCGPTAVCSGSRSVDFARVDVGRPGVDVVGVYHRYCAIQGLRSCVRDDRRIASWAQQWADLRCGAARWLGGEAACLRQLALYDIDGRRQSIQAAWDAPFWREGGDLYVHVLLPHMPAEAEPMPSLGAAYRVNLARAASFLETMAFRLQQRFPDFRLVVFSDHGLRPINKCNAAYSGNCERPAEYANQLTVPLIVASPKPLEIHPPASNLELFDLWLR